MKRLKSIKRKLIATLVFSIFASLGAIIHGVFLDLDTSQLQRLSIEGILITFAIVFPSILLLEWIFDLENKEEFKVLENRVASLERKRK